LLLYIFFPNRPGGHITERIFTQNGLKDRDSGIDVPFAVKIKTFNSLTLRLRKPPKFRTFWAGLTKFSLDFAFNPSLGNCSFATFAGNGGGLKLPPSVSVVLEHSDNTPTATSMFLGSNFLMVVLPISWDVDVRQKSKWQPNYRMAITLLVFEMRMSFQKQ